MDDLGEWSGGSSLVGKGDLGLVGDGMVEGGLVELLREGCGL